MELLLFYAVSLPTLGFLIYMNRKWERNAKTAAWELQLGELQSDTMRVLMTAPHLSQHDIWQAELLMRSIKRLREITSEVEINHFMLDQAQRTDELLPLVRQPEIHAVHVRYLEMLRAGSVTA